MSYTYAVLGAGRQGAAAAYDMARWGAAKRVILADLDLSAAEIDLLDDVPATARFYSSLTLELGEVFSLPTLYRICQKENLPHPHITIMALRGGGYLVPVGEGNFSWKNI